MLSAMAEGRLDSLPGNHSPYFAPVVEPTLTTGIQALTVASRTWLRPGASHQAAPEAVPASRQPADPVTANPAAADPVPVRPAAAARARGGSAGTP